jgi:hypothetical protein
VAVLGAAGFSLSLTSSASAAIDAQRCADHRSADVTKLTSAISSSYSIICRPAGGKIDRIRVHE